MGVGNFLLGWLKAFRGIRTERIEFADPKARVTRRLRQQIGLDCQSMPTSHAAVRHRVSWGKARRAETAFWGDPAVFMFGRVSLPPGLGLRPRHRGRRAGVHAGDHEVTRALGDIDVYKNWWSRRMGRADDSRGIGCPDHRSPVANGRTER